MTTSPEHLPGRSRNEDDDEIDELETDGRYSPKTGFYNGGSMDMRISSILDDLPGSSTKSTPLNLPIRTLEGPSDLDVVMPEYGCPTAPTPDLLGAFSTRAHCSVLIDHFFNDINWMRQPLPQQSLRKSFEAFWNSGPKINAQNINIFALLCNVCAIAMLSVQHHLFTEGPRDRLKAARRYHYAGRRALLMSSIMGREDVDQIVAWLASCRFLLLDRRIGEAYTLGSSAVRAAFSIGLHRDGTRLGLSPAETEARRRVWAAVYFLDRALALNTGRPAVIDDRVCDTQVPSGVMDEDIFPAPKHPPRMPEGVEPPTAYSYTVFRQRIAELEGRILATFQNLQHPVHVSDVLALDKDMRELQDNLPFYFRARLTKDGVECDKSLDDTYGFLNVHRFLLHTEINSVRIALHRPYLLRSGGPNGAKFLPCREASLNAALHDLEMRSDFVNSLKNVKFDGEPVLLYRVQIGTYKYFHSLLVVGVVLLMDPNAPDAPRLKGHLEHYINNYKQRPASQRDEMRDREANVISIFLSRIEQAEKASGPSKPGTTSVHGASRGPKRGRSTDTGHRGDTNDREGKSTKRSRDIGADHGDEKSDAHLLLGLGTPTRSGTGAENSPDPARSRPTPPAANHSEQSTFSPRQNATLGHSVASRMAATGSASRSASGDWTYNQRGLPNAVVASSSTSSSDSPTTSLPAVVRGNAAGDSLTSASSTPNVAAVANGGGEDAQQFFDAWYQAEWAAATMPSYDAAYNGANSLGGGGVSLGLDSLGSLGGVFNSVSNGPGASTMSVGQGLGGGFNGLGGPSIGGFAPNTPSAIGPTSRPVGALTPGAVMSGWTSQSAPLSSSYADPNSSLADLIPHAPINSNAGPWQQQQQQQNSAAPGAQAHNARLNPKMPLPDNASTSFGGNFFASGAPASGTQSDEGQAQQQAGQQNFDPAFWQTLIDKIVT
uniref:Xylanolytic transcriptional activator regulatory domain-containing protein n=2 Tax=Kalmanozyma brasiliensis (strain GHG001) TaxID=1365824 RepID=V5GS32_KALBG